MSRRSAKEARIADDSDGPGLPWLHSWRGVYWFVVGCLVVYLLLLAALTRMFA